MDVQHGLPQQDVLIGQTIGNYLVTQKLGEGGMGSVYLAEHPSIGKKVALKVLHAEFSSNTEVIQRFFHEAKSVNDIGHPNIVDIIDYGVLQASPTDQLVYFIMEYLAGNTLSNLIRTESPLPPERALSICLQVADALAASHKCGIVHRDLKPDNIILLQRARERDFVKLLDFGIAKLTTNNATGSQHRTRTGIVMGTPAYMSPEQCEGRGSVDHRTDIYALGVVLYEMLTGRVPFIGEGYGEILVQHLTQIPVPPSQYRMLPPHVEVVVLKALEKRVELRYPTMDEMMRAMSDPVGYVEANGGIAGFLQRVLTPSMAPVPMRTPAPIGGVTGLTPIPGSLTAQNYLTPGPGTLNPIGQPGGKGKGLYIVAGIAVVAIAAVAIAVVVTGGKKSADPETGSAGSGSAVATVTPGSGSAEVKPVTPPTPPPPTPGSGSSGSAGTTVPVTGPGSATPPVNGSAETAMVELTVESTPPGATIYLNGMEVGTTNKKLAVPRSKDKATMRLALHGYVDETVKSVDLDASSSVTRVLKKVKGGGVAVVPNPNPNPNPNPGKGSGSAAVVTNPNPNPNPKKGSNDTGLMRPDD